MLTRSFCFFPGLRQAGERKLWQKGVLAWRDLEHGGAEGLFSQTRCDSLRGYAAEARQALAAGDVTFFLSRLPLADQLRIIPDFVPDTGFLDVETDSLHQDARLTTAALLTRDGLRVFVRGFDLDHLPQALAHLEMIVTYNGTDFDLAILGREFDIAPDQPHVDLCPVLHAWGYFGGLKAIARRLGVVPKTPSPAMSGHDAALLWESYTRTADPDALHRLAVYNAHDALMLLPLAWRLWKWSMGDYPLRLSPPAWRAPSQAHTPWGPAAL